MSNYSYRYGQPREEVHYARYGSTDVPARRGMGGAPLNPGNPEKLQNSVNWVAVIAGIGAILSGLAMIWEATRST